MHRYTGSNCQSRINECDSSPCASGATCMDHIHYYTCHCPYGFTGKHCEAYVDWCTTNPCMNGAQCRQRDHSYQCLCDVGWTGKVCDVEMVSCSDAAIRKGKSDLVKTTFINPLTDLFVAQCFLYFSMAAGFVILSQVNNSFELNYINSIDTVQRKCQKVQ